ncbi:hypothetical protein MmiHf6_06620 [Methanimicrococcus hongohii]|uniref:Uncharacterized protein n=1 Tax=Methanimicrococcus hongohii TaxID=3028295 RepID=A0AA96V148_9EURY|nr:hypothetical protein [Methanimicrococcus sp. Hf6]WNY23355.1 hypothetical protein MmiHf6_06620 [Methanimicrococcus sp. Hf6]
MLKIGINEFVDSLLESPTPSILPLRFGNASLEGRCLKFYSI